SDLDDGSTARIRHYATHPLFTFLAFVAIVYYTHLPVTTDRLMATQWGSFVIDTLWLGAGLLYWWPVIGPAGHRPGFAPGLRMAYLFANMVFMTADRKSTRLNSSHVQ